MTVKRSATPSPLDVLAIGAHPDDAEMFAGGTIARLVQSGKRVGILALTRGESASRGTVAGRAKESAAAAKILGLAFHQTLDLGDGDLANTQARRRAVVEQIRALRPRVILTHWPEDRHPDHRRAHELVVDAAFLANVGKFPAKGERWQTEALCFCLGNSPGAPPRVDWTVDVTESFDLKMKAISAYKSQVLAGGKGPRTYISSDAFWKDIDTRARFWGHRIGATHGEAFVFDRPAHAGHPFVALLAL